MGFIIGFVLSMMFLEGIWRFLVIIPLAAIEVFEIMLWLKWRRIRSITGAESIPGATGVALTDLNPTGQVKVRGQIWKAHAAARVDAGEEVTVLGHEGLMLEVASPGRRAPEPAPLP